MRWLNYHHLMYFRMIASEGGIAKAAEKLRLGQPALSSQLKTLEEFFGHPLFERRNRRLYLTDAGKVTLQYANEIFEKGQELLEVIKDQTFSSKIHVHLGALDSVPKTLITKMVESARKIKPCQITLLEGRGEELLREVMTHQLDLMISDYPAPTKDISLYSRSIAKVPIAIFGASKFKGLKKTFPKSLAGQPMILPTSHSKLRQDVAHFFSVNRMVHETVAEIQDTSVQKLLASDGLGIIPLPEFSAREHVREKKLFKLGVLKGVYQEYWIISAERTIENPIASKLMEDFRFAF